MSPRLILYACVAAGCGSPPSTADGSSSRFDGQYLVTFDPQTQVKINDHGTLLRAAGTRSDTVSFTTRAGQQLSLQLGSLCARPEVGCPDELLDPTFELTAREPAAFTSVRARIELSGQRELEGWLYSGRALWLNVGLGDSTATFDNCVPLFGLSGRLTLAGEAEVDACRPDGGNRLGSDCQPGQLTEWVAPATARATGIAGGVSEVSISGQCAFGPAGADLTLRLATGFTAAR